MNFEHCKYKACFSFFQILGAFFLIFFRTYIKRANRSRSVTGCGTPPGVLAAERWRRPSASPPRNRSPRHPCAGLAGSDRLASRRPSSHQVQRLPLYRQRIGRGAQGCRIRARVCICAHRQSLARVQSRPHLQGLGHSQSRPHLQRCGHLQGCPHSQTFADICKAVRTRRHSQTFAPGRIRKSMRIRRKHCLDNLCQLLTQNYYLLTQICARRAAYQPQRSGIKSLIVQKVEYIQRKVSCRGFIGNGQRSVSLNALY